MMLLLNCWNHESSIMKRALVRADPPSQALVRYEPSRVIKKSSVTLYCSVEDPGKPENTQYMWLRGNHVVRNATNAKWTIPQVTFEADSNFTCIAYNEGGQSPPGTVNIEVLGEFNHSKLTNITFVRNVSSNRVVPTTRYVHFCKSTTGIFKYLEYL